MATTAGVIRLCTCLRYWPYCALKLRIAELVVCATVGNCGTDFQLVCFEQTLTDLENMV